MKANITGTNVHGKNAAASLFAKKKVSLKEQTNLHTLLISFLPQKQICEKTTVVINRYSQSNIEWYLQTAIDATRTRDFVKPG